ncbi:MAG: hypothetical protein O2931_01305 [Planctomycetota bacterium]|nr:hypothetical protein [Planctomycetota bacterium]MDA1177410.1 hypothetical protein [Planctomycetota bacterium]
MRHEPNGGRASIMKKSGCREAIGLGNRTMTHHGRLRVYFGPEDDASTTSTKEQRSNSVTLPLSEVIPILLSAVHEERGWLNDFADDEVTLSTDLYEVLLAYQHYRRPSA